MFESGPCTTARFDLQLLIMISGALTSIVTLWLAHRRALADDERKAFYRQMRDKHGLDHPQEDVGRRVAKRQKR